ncbi:hypothetical protein ILUMI_09165 [Ignelater luminosus]|uniref:Mutator-like transposase domain-containing protein n=1 Tax=Ignelater luminosus TaxID=2038154 RepID=A0A8K0D0I1_IGNLU|nr:hypothetical protein ILUMI_09165 [Ignelater luminosus]
MKKAADEERKLAMEAGDTEEGIPFITMIVGGGWARHSYGHGFSLLSGVGCNTGHRTKKLLYIGVKNKFCFVCANAKSRNTDAPTHVCFKNYTGSSFSMEQDTQ